MDLISGTKTIIYLKDISNGNPVALTLNGANLRFINIASSDITEVERWSVRTAEEDVNFTGLDLITREISLVNVSDASKIRKGEILEIFGSGDYMGAVIITGVDETTGVLNFKHLNGQVDSDINLGDSLKLRKDPFMLDGFTKPIDSFTFPYLVVEADGACELGIEALAYGNYI